MLYHTRKRKEALKKVAYLSKTCYHTKFQDPSGAVVTPRWKIRTTENYEV